MNLPIFMEIIHHAVIFTFHSRFVAGYNRRERTTTQVVHFSRNGLIT